MFKKSLIWGALLTLVFAGTALFQAIDAASFVQLKEGGEVEQRDGAPASDRTMKPEPLVAVARKWMPDDLCELLLPITMTVKSSAATPSESTPITIRELVYAGSTNDAAHAKLLAVALPQGTDVLGVRDLLSAEDRRKPLPDVANSVAGKLKSDPNAPDWFLILSINADWAPWQLSLTVIEAVAPTSQTAKVPPYLLAKLNDRARPFKAMQVNTGRVRLPLPRGDYVELRAAIGFGPETISFAFLPSEAAGTVPVPGEGGYTIAPDLMSGEASSAVSIPDSFVNYIFEAKYKNAPLLIGRTSENKEVRVIGPRALASEHELLVTGAIDAAPFKEQMSTTEGVKISFEIRFSGKAEADRDLRFDASKLALECGALTLSECLALRVLAGKRNGEVNKVNKDLPLGPKDILPLGVLLLDSKSMEATAKILRAQAVGKSVVMSGHISLEEK